MKINLLLILFSFCTLSFPGNGIAQSKAKKTFDFTYQQQDVEELIQLGRELMDEHPPQALLYAEKALELADSLQYTEGKGKSLLLLAEYYKHTGLYDKSIDKSLKALRIFESLNHQEESCRALLKLGAIYRRIGQIDKSLFYDKQALEISDSINNTSLTAEIFDDLAKSYLLADSVNEALFYYNESLEIYEEKDNKKKLAEIYSNLANIFFETGKLSTGLDYLQKGLLLSIKTGNKRHTAKIHYQLSIYFHRLQKNNEALVYAEKALAASSQLKDKALEHMALEVIAKIHAEEGEYKLAYQYLLDANHIKDNYIDNTEAIRLLHELQQAYDDEKEVKKSILLEKEQQIQKAKLSRNNTILTISILGLFLSIILLIILISNFRQKQKALLLLSERNKEIFIQSQELQYQKQIIEETNTRVTDSINYALKIQQSILPPVDYIASFLPNHFIIYAPRDIVSGDFYWFSNINGVSLISAIDCTGHGVPGAFMSMLGSSLLDRIVNDLKLTDPAKIMDQLNIGLQGLLKQKQNDNQDGMDMSMVAVNHKNRSLTFAGAKNDLYIAENNELTVLKGDRASIGGGLQPRNFKTFENKTYQLTSTDSYCYLLTDGFPDQFGGAKQKKYSKKRLRESLSSIYNQDINQQKQSLTDMFQKWKKDVEQTDDVLVIGFKA